MITLSIILCVFANAVRYADLADTTTVRSLKDYINYSNKIAIVYNIVWFIITFVIWFATLEFGLQQI